MRCPTCGARNADSAEWCTQCYESLRVPEEPPVAPEPDAALPTPVTSPDEAARPDEPGETSPDDADVRTAGQFRRVGDRFEWVCRICGTWNEVGVLRCVTCNTGFGHSVAPTEPEPLPLEQPVALVASAVLPGLGHLLNGQTATGLVRVMLFLLWAVGAWLIGSEAVAAGQSALPMFPLLIGAALMWVVSLYDVRALYTDSPPLLSGRLVLWSVVGVFGLTGLLFVASVMQVSGSS